jgi:hypothetical protein
MTRFTGRLNPTRSNHHTNPEHIPMLIIIYRESTVREMRNIVACAAVMLMTLYTQLPQLLYLAFQIMQ